MKRLPIVALIGQTNAGKSSILNRMARKNIAIVAREEGTTRDNVVATIDNSFVLVDTAGLKDPSDDFEASIQDQITDAIDSADAILVVIDSSKYFDHRDAKITKDALKSKKPVYLVLNKCDLKESLPLTEFRALGVDPKNTFYVSATTSQGMSDLRGALKPLFRGLSEATAENEGASDPSLGKVGLKAPLKLALIGRPNVGKSSLFNTLGKKQQAIVSSKQGTTRDVNRMTVKYKGREIEILDTAGLRRPGKREVGIEKFSAIRTLAAIEEADICCLLVDSTEPHVKLDQTLAGQIMEAGKGIIMVVTKIDLFKSPSEGSSTSLTRSRLHGARSLQPASKLSGTRSQTLQSGDTDKLLDELEWDFDFLPYAPVILTSSETGANVTQIFELALDIDEARHTEIPTSELNKILAEAVSEHLPAGLKNTHPKPKYLVQTDTCPPWFVLHGHSLGLLHWSWKRFLERKVREKYPMIGVPIKFSYRSDDK